MFRIEYETEFGERYLLFELNKKIISQYRT